MGIAIVIVSGLVLMTVVAAFADYKSKAVRHGATGGGVEELRKRVAALEDRAVEKDERIHALERDVGFLSRLLEDKSGPK